jgi:Rnl2 family RNA ligase
VFIKYPSLTNHYQQKELDWWLEQYPGIADAEYVCTEKIHGSNIQFIFDGLFHIASRKRVLKRDENFFDVWNVVNNSDRMLDFLWAIDQWRATSDHRQINLYGELFGRGIQKGVDYGDAKRILLFDVVIDGQLQSWNEFCDFMYEVDAEDLMIPQLGTTANLRLALDFNCAELGFYIYSKKEK